MHALADFEWCLFVPTCPCVVDRKFKSDYRLLINWMPKSGDKEMGAGQGRRGQERWRMEEWQIRFVSLSISKNGAFVTGAFVTKFEFFYDRILDAFRISAASASADDCVSR